MGRITNFYVGGVLGHYKREGEFFNYVFGKVFSNEWFRSNCVPFMRRSISVRFSPFRAYRDRHRLAIQLRSPLAVSACGTYRYSNYFYLAHGAGARAIDDGLEAFRRNRLRVSILRPAGRPYFSFRDREVQVPNGKVAIPRGGVPTLVYDGLRCPLQDPTFVQGRFVGVVSYWWYQGDRFAVRGACQFFLINGRHRREAGAVPMGTF